MPEITLPTTPQAFLAALERRVAALERRGAPAPTTAGGGREVARWGASAVPAGDIGTPHMADQAGRLARFRARLLTAGTTATTVELRLNGAAVAVLTLAAGQAFAECPLYDPVAVGDYLTAVATAVGTGAAHVGADALILS